MSSINPDLLQRLKDVATPSSVTVEDLLASWLAEQGKPVILPVKALELAIDAVISINEAQEIVFYSGGRGHFLGMQRANCWAGPFIY